jgi:hypothetical protein
MAKNKSMDILRVHYKFMLDDDDSGGPTGPDYLIMTMSPRRADLKNRIAKQLDLTIYLNEGTSADTGKLIERLLSENVGWVQIVIPRG